MLFLIFKAVRVLVEWAISSGIKELASTIHTLILYKSVILGDLTSQECDEGQEESYGLLPVMTGVKRNVVGGADF